MRNPVRLSAAVPKAAGKTLPEAAQSSSATVRRLAGRIFRAANRPIREESAQVSGRPSPVEGQEQGLRIAVTESPSGATKVEARQKAPAAAVGKAFHPPAEGASAEEEALGGEAAVDVDWVGWKRHDLKG